MIDELVNYYTTNFAIAYSPEGKYVAVADRYGKLSIFDFRKVIRAGQQESKTCRWSIQFAASKCPIYALMTKEDLLICGCGDGQMIGYSWAGIIKQNTKPVFIINTNSTGSEINAVLDNNEDSLTQSSALYTAGGDCEIHCWDIESNKEKTSFSGHTDMIHCLSWGSDNCIISGSEDGTVRFWDVRIGKDAVHVLNPFDSDCCRKNRGKWIGALASNRDWLVCGGGPQLGLWHIGSYNLVSVLETADIDHHCVSFHEDKIIGCGGLNSLNYWNFKGELTTYVDKTPSTVYDIKSNCNSSKNTVLCVCGDGPKVDLFLNLGYSSYLLDTSILFSCLY